MRPNRRFCLPRIERLEPRQVLAHAGFVGLDDAQLLTILGSSKKDHIDVTLSGDQIVVELNHKTHSFAAAGVAGLYINGGSGNDWITVDDLVDVDAVLHGGNGHDNIQGGGGNDTIFGGTGHDQLHGGAGNDWLDGAQGHDKLSGGDGDDTLLAGVGHDTLWGDAGKDQLYGHVGADKLSGGDGDDSLFGGGGKDSLSGGEGNDSLAGEGGHDELFGDGGNDWLDGGAGHDKLHGGDGDDSLKGGAGHDLLDGDAGTNLLDGDAGKNTLRNGTEVDFESLPPTPPPEPDFPTLSADVTMWNNPTPVGTAVWDQQSSTGGLETFLLVSVHGLFEGLNLPVFIGETFQFLGVLVVGADGTGTLKISNIVDETGELGYPSLDFTVTAGTTIYVGDGLSGVFAAV